MDTISENASEGAIMALPGLRGTDHIGFTVPNLDDADDFLVRVLGCRRIYDLASKQSDDEFMAEHLNVHPRTVITRIRFYRCAMGANFEVFEYDAADGQAPQPRNSDIGGHHIAFYVDDLDVAISYLESEGVQILGDPTVSMQGAEGQSWVYFLAPWGMQFELVSYPGGKAYEKDADVLLWHPACPEA